ncbi:MAG: hypothetical protein IJT14_01065 [Rickettsiales bacterium]|nr:hypothetical protein [Rickettsiales bacterium]
MSFENQTTIPTRIIEGLNINHLGRNEQVDFPVATYETPLFASIKRGVKVSRVHPISVAVLSDCMTRSVIFQCKNVIEVERFLSFLDTHKTSGKMQEIVAKTSHHCKILNVESQVVGNLVYVRFVYDTGEAAGHNMTTIATNEIAKWLASNFDGEVKYISNSGNTCCDKKVSAINSISGRGKHVVAEVFISRQTCAEILKTTPEKMADLNIKKNFVGSMLGGSVCSANAHYANMLAALYLPLGQDVANIVEGSQGITYCDVNSDGNLYFSVNLPNIICGCVGNGKELAFVRENMKTIGCIKEDGGLIDGASKRMAAIIGAVVLCGELSLMAALTNKDELVRSHLALERKK